MTKPRVLTTVNLGILSAIAGRIVPEEDGSPGAVTMGAVSYILRSLGEERARFLAAYQGGLDAVNAGANDHFGKGFSELSPEEQDGFLEANWESDLAEFLDLVRVHLIEGMFADPRWGGNIGGSGWALLGYGGPRRVWTAAEQVVVGPGVRTEIAAEPAEAALEEGPVDRTVGDEELTP